MTLKNITLRCIWIRNYVYDYARRTLHTYFNRNNSHQETPNKPVIIPEPYMTEYRESTLALPETITFTIDEHRDLTLLLLKRHSTDHTYVFTTDPEKAFLVCKKGTLSHKNAYQIEITEKDITVTYQNEETLRYAISTFVQLSRNATIPCGSMYDFPTCLWRGVLLDVARHYMPPAFIKELIEKMYLQKLNILHLHLSDDQGWRFESKQYPRLHQIGSIRKETVIGNKLFPFVHRGYTGDGMPHEGFYTQESLRELVQYAIEYGITIVPEIDIPGHSTALLTAYPEYAAHNAPHKVETDWGVFKNVLSPEDHTLVFLKNIFKEICGVFPSAYIHIGGDEVPTDYYKKNQFVKKLVQTKKLKTYEDAPSYILEEIATYLRTQGRTPVMWDEGADIAQKTGGIIMVWRDVAIAEEMAQKNIPYVYCPASHLYFDYYQYPDTKKQPLAIGGYTPIESVYQTPIKRNDLLLGIQANMWSEYTKTPDAVRYMLFPRTYALAELAWGNYHKDLKAFLAKVAHAIDLRK